ncbi:MAG: homoserine kinase [Hydrotalea sp.]|nr:homoserine kinase [Hydrotalea sp.]
MAVYTHLTQGEIADVIADYNIGRLLSANEIVKGVSNSNYLLRVAPDNAPATKYIFTIFEERTDADDLPFCFGLTDHLAKRGFPCPLPLKNKHDQIVTMVKDKPAVIISFLPGSEKEQWNDADCFSAGETLARLHNTTRDFAMTRDNKLSLTGWEKLWATANQQFHNPTIAGDMATLTEKFAVVKNYWRDVPPTMPRGACHADFFPDNVFFADAKTARITGVIDFYFACTDFLAYDLAIAVTAWCFQNANRSAAFQPKMCEQLLAGYLSLRPLQVDEKKYFINLLIGAAWRFALTRFYDFHAHRDGDIVKPKDPAFYRAMLDWLLLPDSQSTIKKLLP